VKRNLIDTTKDNGVTIASLATGAKIVGNELYNIGGPSGIEANIDGLLIDENTLKMLAGHAIVAWGSRDWVVTGNYIEGTNGCGILLGNGSNDWTVSSNTIHKCRQDGIFIDANSDHNTIDRNRVSGCATGVRVSSLAENNIVTSNTLVGNTVDFIDDGTGTVEADNVVQAKQL
jgi:parallel beta-helix repeat protein